MMLYLIVNYTSFLLLIAHAIVLKTSLKNHPFSLSMISRATSFAATRHF